MDKIDKNDNVTGGIYRIYHPKDLSALSKKRLRIEKNNI